MATIFHLALYLRSRYLSTGVGYTPEREARGGVHSGGLRHHAFLSPYHFLLGGNRSSCYFNLTVFVLFVQEYGRKHVSELAEGQGEGQGEWQGGPYSIVQE